MPGYILYPTSVMGKDEIAIYSPGSRPYHSSFSTWSIRWWKWLLGISVSENPSIDLTGDRAGVFQNDPNVFFLCQTFGNHTLIPNRDVIVPFGKDIFMPIINWISVMPEDGTTTRELLITAKQKIDTVQNLSITINNKRIEIDPCKHRVTSGIFELYIPENNILGREQGPAVCLSDGYWIFFKPAVRHIELSSYGSCSTGLNKIRAAYSIRFK